MIRLIISVWLFICLFAGVKSKAQSQAKLSENAEISIITIGPYYEELFSAFGHSAIRVNDPIRQYDAAYNYGTFDFDQPNFYLNFVRGIPFYKLSVVSYQALESIYKRQDRYIREQILDLNQVQKQKLFEFLQNNARPENAGYYYDYFYDNCATRLPNAVIQVFGDSVVFEDSHITERKSIRELCDDYLVGYYPWGDFGIDFCLGLPMDKKITPFQYMYLPDYVEYGFANAYFLTDSGEKKPLVKESTEIYSVLNPPQKASFVSYPIFVFALIAILIGLYTWRNWQQENKGRILDVILFGLLGLLGVFLVLLWALTNHKAAAFNFNLLWVIPFHLAAVLPIARRDLSVNWVKYFKVVAIVSGLSLLTWPLIPQMIHTSVIPVFVLIAIRCSYISWGAGYAPRAKSAKA